jgi:Holliday junction DNA helicase RuvA|tara:strand:+ start:443990 stop:444646 length:657 start_codon:yes stop_codon:yes gene_type:complete
MIAKLKGKIDTLGSDYLIIDVGGVCYMVHASAKTLSVIGDVGSDVALLIEMQVREDSMTLFGFASAEEQAWYKLLTSVQGVGAKVGIAILSACPADQLVMAVMSGDKEVVRQAEGVGPKLAVRIITELKDKVSKMDIGMGAASAQSSPSGDDKAAGGTVNITAEGNDNQLNQDALSALINLGYARAEAYKAVISARSKFKKDPDLGLLISAGLKELVS